MARRAYPSDLSDREWALLAPLLPAAKPGGRPRSVDLREIVNAIRYWRRGGVAWRALPHDLPAWQTVSHYWRAWRLSGDWERIHTRLRAWLRVRAGRATTPSAGLIDSQSVTTTEKGDRRTQRALTGARKGRDASAICSWTPPAWWSRRWSTPPRSPTGWADDACSKASPIWARHCPACATCGSTAPIRVASPRGWSRRWAGR
jgi:transposase